jgi:hypothetical protein
VTTWADPYENMIGRIYQILAFQYTGRMNRGISIGFRLAMTVDGVEI